MPAGPQRKNVRDACPAEEIIDMKRIVCKYNIIHNKKNVQPFGKNVSLRACSMKASVTGETYGGVLHAVWQALILFLFYRMSSIL